MQTSTAASPTGPSAAHSDKRSKQTLYIWHGQRHQKHPIDSSVESTVVPTATSTAEIPAAIAKTAVNIAPIAPSFERETFAGDILEQKQTLDIPMRKAKRNILLTLSLHHTYMRRGHRNRSSIFNDADESPRFHHHYYHWHPLWSKYADINHVDPNQIELHLWDQDWDPGP